MRPDTLLHVYDEATDSIRTLQIPYAFPEACPADPDTLRVCAVVDGSTIFATSDWVWAETDTPPASDGCEFSTAEFGGPVAVRYRNPATGDENGVWFENAIVTVDGHGRPCVLDAATRFPLGLFRAPAEVLSSMYQDAAVADS